MGTLAAETAAVPAPGAGARTGRAAPSLEGLLETYRPWVGRPGAVLATRVDPQHVVRFAEAIGDPNPLYVDPAVARRSRYRGCIAPPTFLCALPYDCPYLPQPDGVGVLNVANAFTLVRPVRVGEQVITRAMLTEVRPRGHLLMLALECAYAVCGLRVATGTITWVLDPDPSHGRSAPPPAQGRPLPDDRPGQPGRPAISVAEAAEAAEAAEVAGIGRAPEAHVPWPAPAAAALTPGMALPPLEKPRITSVQLVRYAAATGDFSPIHYDERFALSTGLPGVLVHGLLRMAVLAQHAVTWMGPDGELLQLTARYRGMDLRGDRLTSRGAVRAVQPWPDGRTEVRLDLHLANQRGEENTVGAARVALPSPSA